MGRIFPCSLRTFRHDQESRLLLGKEASSAFSASPELLRLKKLEFARVDHTHELFLVSFCDAVSPHGIAHGGDKEASHLERSMNIFHCLVRHVAGHPSAARCDDIELVFEVCRELIDTLTKEEVVMLLVKSAFAYCIQKVG